MKKILVVLLALGSLSTFACNVNSFVGSAKGQKILNEMDQEFKLELEQFLERKGMSKDEFSVDSDLPNSFISINPNGQYQWSHLKVNFPKGLKAKSGIVLKKKTKETLDVFNRTTESKCGVEIVFEGGLLYSSKWNKTVHEKAFLMGLPTVSRFVELE